MKKFQSIRSRLFYSYATLIFIVIVFFASFFYSYTSDLLENKASQNLQQLSLSLSNSLDTEFKNMNAIANRIITSEPIKKMFYSITNATEFTPQNKSDIFNLLFTVTGSSLDYQINLIGVDGKFIEFGKAFDICTKNSDIITSNSWVLNTLLREGNPFITPPHINNWNAKEDVVISLSRSFYEVFGGKYDSIVEIQQYYSVFKKIIERTLDNLDSNSTLKVYVYDPYGYQVYPYVNPHHPPKNSFNYYNAITYAPPTQSILSLKVNQDKQIVSFSKSNYSNWTIIICESQSTLLAPVKTFRNMILATGFIILLITLLLTYIISRQLTIPLKKIYHSIRKLNLTALNSTEPLPKNSTTYELEILNNSYIEMVARLEQSLAETVQAKSHEIQAQMLALQAQMNPHFLYNIITIMSIKAENTHQLELAMMCEKLSHMLRYISKNTASIVSIETELNYVNDYVTLMHCRYPNEFKIDIDIPLEMHSILIPKLTLQPLIENCFKHAFDKRPPWLITIQGNLDETNWRISIIDNGIGFDQTMLNQISKKIKQLSPITTHTKNEHIGLLNIFYRLNYHYKDATYFKIENKPLGGCIITIGGTIKEVLNNE